VSGDVPPRKIADDACLILTADGGGPAHVMKIGASSIMPTTAYCTKIKRRNSNPKTSFNKASPLFHSVSFRREL